MDPLRRPSVPLMEGPDPLAAMRRRGANADGFGAFKVSTFASPQASPVIRRGRNKVGNKLELPAPGGGGDMHQPLTSGVADNQEGFSEKVVQPIIFGLINVVVLVPLMVGFSNIIFADPFFAPYRPLLIKLTLVSAFVHQIMFSLFSTLPFAMGQVQDAGLIFLSQMARSVVELCKEKKASPEDTMNTVLWTLAVSTAVLGFFLVLTGHYGLAELVQYLPMPVVSGYLAFIGLYCFDAGLNLVTGLDIQGPQDWIEFKHWDPVRLTLPALALGLVLYILPRVSHRFVPERFQFMVLPFILMCIPFGFYAILFASGGNMQSARDNGWMDKNTDTIMFWDMWSMISFKGIYWSVMPHQIGAWIGMYFIVAFGSSLDVAAISIAQGRNLDYNAELKAIGYSNLVSGLSFGFTGSYIFSQTIFTMRTGLKSRGIGIVVIICEIIVTVLPKSILAFLPSMFFGSVMLLIGIDLLYDWLLESRHKFGCKEYIIVWFTFIAICATNLQVGMLSGCVLTALYFSLQYAWHGTQVQGVSARSGVIRTIKQQQILSCCPGKIQALRVSGHIFFGSALGLLRKVKSILPDWKEEPEPTLVDTSMTTIVLHDDSAPQPDEFQFAAPSDALAFLILDLTQVTGLDATAVSTCFQPLSREAMDRNCTLVIVATSPDCLDLLTRAEVLQKPDAADQQKECANAEMGQNGDLRVRAFGAFQEAVEWCEDQVVSLQQFQSMASPKAPATPNGAIAQATGLVDLPDMESHFDLVVFEKDAEVFAVGAQSDELYIIKEGSVEVKTKAGVRVSRIFRGAFFGDLDFFLKRPRTLRATAVVPSKVWRFKQTTLDKLLKDEPQVAAAFLQATCQGLALAAADLVDRATMD